MSSEFNNSNLLKAELNHERIRLLFANAPVVIGGGIAVCLVVVIMFWSTQPHELLLSWFSINTLILLFRIWPAYKFKQSILESRTANYLAILYSVGSLLGGVAWGMLPWLILDPSSTFSVVSIIVVTLGMVAAAVATNSAYPISFFVFAIPAVLLLAVRLGLEEGFIYLSLLLLLFLFVNLSASIKYFRLITNSTEKGLKNISLISQLENKREEAEKASADKSRFLAAASHDLRQPHQALGLFLESLDYLESDRKKKNILNKTKLAFEAMSGLLEQLLDISKLDAKTVQPEFQSIELQPFLHRITMEYMGQAEQHGLELRLRPTNAFVHSDPKMLHRILSNLISNAIRYTDKGGILLGVRRHSSSWRLFVCDTGRGIPKKAQESIFQEFTQLSNPERDREKGLGLGLAIVRRLGDIMGADVSVQSQEDKGSCFSIMLPEANEDELTAPIEIDTDSMVSLKGLKIAIIDDDKIALEALSTLLNVWHCQVHAFASGKACIQKLTDLQWKPDALIVDYRLRGEQTGVGAIQAVCKKLNHRIPALIITGDTAPERIEEAQASGFPLLHKPVDPDQLRRFLSKLR